MANRSSMDADRIPSELWLLILSFLPVQKLLMIRAVSKFFAVLIDSDLVTLHLRGFSNNRRESHVITLVRDHICYKNFPHIPAPGSNRVDFEIRDVTNNARQKFSTELQLQYSEYPIVVASLDGLTLVMAKDEKKEFREDGVPMLWNPSIRKSRKLPLPHPCSDFTSLRYGLGYDPCCKDYKVLAMTKHGSDRRFRIIPSKQEVRVWVYALKTRSWTAVDVENSGLSTCGGGDWGKWWMCHPLPVQGGLSWIETTWDCGYGVLTHRVLTHRLACFDFATLKFRYFLMPYDVNQTFINNEPAYLLQRRPVKLGNHSSLAVEDLIITTSSPYGPSTLKPCRGLNVTLPLKPPG